MKTTLMLTAFALFLLCAAPAADAAPSFESSLAAAEASGGYWKTVQVKVWQPGHYDREWVEPVYRRRYYRGCWRNECISRGYYHRVWHRGHYRYQSKRIWVDDYPRERRERRPS
ncbi:MAG: hypothetical protein V3W41_00180 [Planctomycetota bacterium]